jgi:DNA-binding MarR family transcriptional regulator
LRLTNTGKAALAAAKPMWQAAQRSLEQRLGRAEVKSLNTTLEDTLDRISAR